MLAVASAVPGKLPNIVAAIPPAASIVETEITSKPMSSGGGLPPFISMPQSSAQLTDRISNSPTVLKDSDNEVSKDDYNQVNISASMILVTLQTRVRMFEHLVKLSWT